MNVQLGKECNSLRKATSSAVLALLATAASLFATALWAQNSSDFAAGPPLNKSTAPPRIMLLMSNDQQLYYKAYTDYTDLDGDGVLDTQYNDAFDYYGYFNEGLCYDYQNSRFEPTGTVSNGHKCSGNWSGNFLNWATMTRIDIVRRVYYGGMRVVDTVGETVLQRALLPNDAHAFVKTHSTDVGSYTPYNYGTISMCNVTLAAGQSNTVDKVANPPLVRVADGDFPLWSATEVVQCMYQGEAPSAGRENRPVTGDDLIVRVQSCVTGQDANVTPVPGGEDYCREYGSTPVYKPAGILQFNSENGSIHFGLMTGTHSQKMNGGILRSNMGALAGNASAADDEIDLSNGRFRYLNGSGFTGGIIQTLDSMRIAGWNFTNRKYDDCPTYSISEARFKANPNECKDWGNPLAEMYMEALRYFAAEGNSAISAFSTSDDSAYLSGMGTEAWQDPLSASEPCAQCSIIVMSTGLNSFDADELGLVSGLPNISGVGDITAKTDAIVANEVADGGLVAATNVMVGNSDGTTNNNTCSAKVLGDLSDVLGICPELPSMEGSYNLAGLASYAQTTDIRPGNALPDVQRIDTYTIALAESLPSFLFDTQNGDSIAIVPACQASADGGSTWLGCTLMDATVVEKTADYTRIDIPWEDSLWGNDFDLDGMMSIEVCTAVGNAALTQCQYNGAVPTNQLANYQEWRSDAAASQIQVRISVPHAFAGNQLRFGAVVAGTLADNTYYNALRPGGTNYTCVQPGFCNATAQSRMVWAAPVLLTAGASAIQFLENPLWYAAKYGNFKNSDTKSVPTDITEWDNVDLDGNPTPDGLPDAYFPVRNPGQLSRRMKTIIDTIEKNAASGSSVAVTLERRDGVGGTFQAYYFPQFKDPTANTEVNWVGGLHALFLDGDLNLREDSNSNGTLDSTDTVINLFYDGENTVVQRVNADGSIAATVPFTDIEPIWDAKDWLGNLTDAQVVAQRAYGSPTGRHIFTWIDQDELDGSGGPDGEVDANEIVDFMANEVSANNRYRILNVASEADGDDLVDYIRGSDLVAGTRSRTIRFGGAASPRVWRLGDIVHSSPVIVGAPADEYDVTFRDESYTAYRNRYLDRRQVVYAGGNDGMLHAFNAGFYEQGSATFSTAATDPVTGLDLTEYDLGAELWAYVPRNLLPHLRWLTENDYPHVFYVDGEPKVYDVNIFAPSATHPNGWGTILVIGFRFGGGDISLDLDGDSTDDFTSRSAYVILDITDPESAPTVLAEITDPGLGYTTVVPTLVKGRLEDLNSGVFSDDEDAWYLVFGSGPAGTDSLSKQNALLKGVSNQSAKIYIYDLVAKAFVDMDSATAGDQVALDTGVANSFVGDPTSEDWNRDYRDDVVYFGLVEGLDPASPSGSLNRLMFSMSTPVGSAPVLSVTQPTSLTTMLDPDQPFQGAPVTYRDLGADRAWVMAGSGRFLTPEDNRSSYASRFYGLLEPLTTGVMNFATITESNLADTTDIVVLDDNTVYDLNTASSPATVRAAGTDTDVETVSELMAATRAAGGWYNELGPLIIGNESGVDILSGESRNYNGSVAINSGVGFVKYAPDQNVCAPSGFSSLRFVDARTGTATRNIFFNAEDAPDAFNIIGDAELLNAESAVQQGAVSKLTVVRTDDGTAVGSSDNYGGIKFDKIGSLLPQSKRQSWRELPIEAN